MIGRQIRRYHLLELNKEVFFHPKSKMLTWDKEVYAGIVERIDDYFLWTDTHWRRMTGTKLSTCIATTMASLASRNRR